MTLPDFRAVVRRSDKARLSESSLGRRFHRSQFCSVSPSTRANSCTFAVTIVASTARAWAAISRSVPPDQASPSFKLCSNFPIFRVCRFFQGKHVQLSQQVFDRLQEPFRTALRATIPKLGGHDDARAHVVLAHLDYVAGDPPFRVPTMPISQGSISLKNSRNFARLSLRVVAGPPSAGSASI
jgi:hypothetical protein